MAKPCNRDQKAQEAVKSAGSWIKYTLAQPFGAFAAGTLFYGIPSSRDDGTVYMANTRACQCPDYQKNNAVCYHVRAVRLHETANAPVKTAPVPAPTTRPSAFGLTSSKTGLGVRVPVAPARPRRTYTDLFPDLD